MSQGSSKEFGLFHLNVTSWSLKAEKYMFNLPQEVHALSINEMHKTDFVELNSKFKVNDFRLYFNTAEPTHSSVSGTHGGEALATRSHVLSKPIDPEVLAGIAQCFNDPLRFAACVIRFKSLSVIFATLYLWCSEGLS